MIECVPNSKSRDQLGKATQVSLKSYFHSQHGPEDSVKFQQVKKGSSVAEEVVVIMYTCPGTC